MPILTNSRPLLRIKLGENVNIREVRAATDLTWGLYEVTYISNLPSQYQSTQNPSEYVWGYPNGTPQDFTLSLPEGNDTTYGGFSADVAQSIFGSFQRTYASGWYTEPGCLTYFPAITRDFHQDLLLFCKWTQRQYRYSGTITNDRYEYLGGGGGSDFSPRYSAPTSSDGAYPWGGSSDLSMPNCTWYAFYRIQEAGASAPLVSVSTGNPSWNNACNWIHAGEPGYSVTTGSGWTVRKNESNFEPGDIICYDEASSGDGGHVAVYEGGGKVSGSWWTNLSGQRATYSTAGRLSDWILSGGGSAYSYRYWHNDRSPGNEFSGRIQGVLRYSNWGNSHGGWGNKQTQSLTLGEAVCAYPDTNGWNSGNQNFPRAGKRYDQGSEDEDLINPTVGKHWRTNQQWNPLNTFTYERTGTYTRNQDGTYSLTFSNWTLPNKPGYSDSLTGSAYLDYETATQGPISGWKMDWN